MLLQAAADTGELALHAAHFTVPTELHAVNGEWNSVSVYVRTQDARARARASQLWNHVYDDDAMLP